MGLFCPPGGAGTGGIWDGTLGWTGRCPGKQRGSGFGDSSRMMTRLGSELVGWIRSHPENYRPSVSGTNPSFPFQSRPKRVFPVLEQRQKALVDSVAPHGKSENASMPQATEPTRETTQAAGSTAARTRARENTSESTRIN